MQARSDGMYGFPREAGIDDVLVRARSLPGANAYGDHTANAVAEAARMAGLRSNAWLQMGRAAEVPGATSDMFAAKTWRRLRPFTHPATMPDWFSPDTCIVDTPALRLLTLPQASVLPLWHAPVIIAADRTTVVADISSRYAPLVNHVDLDLRPMLDLARVIDGPVFLLAGDIWPPNYAHWLLDTLPRLAVLRGRRDVTIAVPAPLGPVERETLALCSIAPERIVVLEPLQAIRAKVLLATDDLPAPPRPGFKGAAWVLRFLSQMVGDVDPRLGKRLYISRADARGRRVLNEDVLMAALAPLGFVRVSLAGMPVAAQAAAFAEAECIVGLHGAGLSNLVFARPETRVLEIFPATYGTAAFAVLAAASRLDYSYIVASEVVPRAWRQLDDVHVDVAAVVAEIG